MKFAVIGKGFIYPRHKKAIERTGNQIVLTCDIDKTKNSDFANWKEMYASPEFKEIDTVTICTPNYLHSEMASEALKLGKRVLCEKPLTIFNDFERLEGVNTVLQLRYHPFLRILRNKKWRKMSVIAKMYRDENYWNSWKGDDKKSGGILYNLGIHYLDLLVWFMGNEYEIKECKIDKKLAKGTIRFKNGEGSFLIEIVNNRSQQGRYLHLWDDNIYKVNLSNKDNLSYEDLHYWVYRYFLNNKGISLNEAKKSLLLVNALLKHNGKIS